MKTQDIWNNLYNKCFGNIRLLQSLRFYSILRHFVCYCANKVLINKFKNKKFVTLKDRQHSPRIIVSLTSFPARINTVWITISSLFEQSERPDKIILWLSKKQFSSKDILPFNLLRLEQFGLEIRLEEEDIRSHKKFYYAFKEYYEDLILLVDDDIIYPSNTIEKLYSRWNSLSGKRVICSYGNITQYDARKKRIPYNKWKDISTTESQPELFFGSGGGTLIKPSYLYKDILNKELFLTLTPLADDIWLNAMCRLGNVKVYRERFDKIFPVRITNNITLSSDNLDKNKNVEQLDTVDEYYCHKIGVKPFSFNTNFSN